MSKAILSIGLLVAAVAVPFIAPAALGLAAGSFAAIAVTAGLEVGLALTSSVLLGPKPPKLTQTNPLDRLYATFEVTTPRKIVFGGPTAAPADVMVDDGI